MAVALLCDRILLVDIDIEIDEVVNPGVPFLRQSHQISMQVNGVTTLAGCHLRLCSSRRCFAFVLKGRVLIALRKSALLRCKIGFQELGSHIVRGQGRAFIVWMLPVVVLFQVTFFLDKAADMAFLLPFSFPISPQVSTI